MKADHDDLHSDGGGSESGSRALRASKPSLETGSSYVSSGAAVNDDKLPTDDADAREETTLRLEDFKVTCRPEETCFDVT